MEFSSANVDSVSLLGRVGGLGAERVQRSVSLGQKRPEEVGEILLPCQLVCHKERQREPREGGGWDRGWIVG